MGRHAKLDDRDRQIIRCLLAAGVANQAELAREYNVGKSTIQRVCGATRDYDNLGHCVRNVAPAKERQPPLGVGLGVHQHVRHCCHGERWHESTDTQGHAVLWCPYGCEEIVGA